MAVGCALEVFVRALGDEQGGHCEVWSRILRCVGRAL